MKPSDGTLRDKLFRFIEHGDEAHRAWLREAIDAFFDGKSRPELRGTGTPTRKYHYQHPAPEGPGGFSGKPPSKNTQHGDANDA